MWLYLLIFIFIVYLATSSTSQKQQHKNFMLSMTLLAIFVGISDMLGGYDRYIYASLFDNIADAVDGRENVSILTTFYFYKTELGYCLWNLLVAQITSNRYIFILLTTLLMYFMFYRAIKQNTENPMIALVIFMALMFFFSFTYLRQMLAASIGWQALPYVRKKNLKMFLLWVGLAITFHNSAIIFLPVYFLPTNKIKMSWITTAFVVCMLIGVSGIASSLFEVYASYDVERVAHAGYDKVEGFRWEYLAEVFFFFYFIKKYYYRIGTDAVSLLSIYLSVVFCCILLVFIRSENGGRLGWFYLIGLFSLFSSIYSNKILRLKPHAFFIVCFCLYLRIVISWGVLLSPYKTFFTPGVREGDYIERKYEYDHNYDSNKFYR